MKDISNYKFLDFEQLSKEIFNYFKENAKHYDLTANQIVGHNNERPAGGLVIDIYLSEYTPEQGEQPSTFFLDEIFFNVDLELHSTGKSTADKSYYTLTDRTSKLALIASELDSYLFRKGFNVEVRQVHTFRAVLNATKPSDTLNNSCRITFFTKLFSEVR